MTEGKGEGTKGDRSLSSRPPPHPPPSPAEAEEDTGAATGLVGRAGQQKGAALGDRGLPAPGQDRTGMDWCGRRRIGVSVVVRPLDRCTHPTSSPRDWSLADLDIWV